MRLLNFYRVIGRLRLAFRRRVNEVADKLAALSRGHSIGEVWFEVPPIKVLSQLAKEQHQTSSLNQHLSIQNWMLQDARHSFVNQIEDSRG
ncbi:hypothetical protein V6N12_007304 [Hibiscus sabdariffa]|uniref:RNase H type-1 domain-containing protein n=1 Tax=Hibiscus sabdariffa TaxID=183260 RepID=A0ABR2F1F4_9ROSI